MLSVAFKPFILSVVMLSVVFYGHKIFMASVCDCGEKDNLRKYDLMMKLEKIELHLFFSLFLFFISFNDETTLHYREMHFIGFLTLMTFMCDVFFMTFCFTFFTTFCVTSLNDVLFVWHFFTTFCVMFFHDVLFDVFSGLLCDIFSGHFVWRLDVIFLCDVYSWCFCVVLFVMFFYDIFERRIWCDIKF